MFFNNFLLYELPLYILLPIYGLNFSDISYYSCFSLVDNVIETLGIIKNYHKHNLLWFGRIKRILSASSIASKAPSTKISYQSPQPSHYESSFQKHYNKTWSTSKHIYAPRFDPQTTNNHDPLCQWGLGFQQAMFRTLTSPRVMSHLKICVNHAFHYTWHF